MNEWKRYSAGRSVRPRTGRARKVGAADAPSHVEALTSSAWFSRFMSPLADRADVLQAELEARGASPKTLELDGGRFVVAAAGPWPPDRRYRVKVITAHHDRVPGTPGALDNSAACAQLLDYVSSRPGAFNTLAVFTDREEQGGDASARQGSWALGEAFAGMGLRSPLVFALDVTGRGDSVVLSAASERLVAPRSGGAASGARMAALVGEIDALADGVARLLAGRIPVLRASIPFGEDLGFICAGIPALTLTVLPRAEAALLASRAGLPAWASPEPPGSLAPATWAKLHGPDDTPDLYEDRAFEAVGSLLSRLGAWKAPATLA